MKPLDGAGPHSPPGISDRQDKRRHRIMGFASWTVLLLDGLFFAYACGSIMYWRSAFSAAFDYSVFEVPFLTSFMLFVPNWAYIGLAVVVVFMLFVKEILLGLKTVKLLINLAALLAAIAILEAFHIAMILPHLPSHP